MNKTTAHLEMILPLSFDPNKIGLNETFKSTVLPTFCYSAECSLTERSQKDDGSWVLSGLFRIQHPCITNVHPILFQVILKKGTRIGTGSWSSVIAKA